MSISESSKVGRYRPPMSISESSKVGRYRPPMSISESSKVGRYRPPMSISESSKVGRYRPPMSISEYSQQRRFSSPARAISQQESIEPTGFTRARAGTRTRDKRGRNGTPAKRSARATAPRVFAGPPAPMGNPRHTKRFSPRARGSYLQHAGDPSAAATAPTAACNTPGTPCRTRGR
jgi:hypothetical protein